MQGLSETDRISPVPLMILTDKNLFLFVPIMNLAPSSQDKNSEAPVTQLSGFESAIERLPDEATLSLVACFV